MPAQHVMRSAGNSADGSAAAPATPHRTTSAATAAGADRTAAEAAARNAEASAEAGPGGTAPASGGTAPASGGTSPAPSPARTAPPAGAVPTALVIGSGAVEVVRALRLAGLPCATVSSPDDATRYSPAVRKVFAWDWSLPMEAHDAALADRMVAWARAQPVPPVLHYSSDPALLFTSRHRARLAGGFRISVPDPELVEAMADKAQFAELADRLDLPVPGTSVIPADASECPAQVRELGFPLLVKPERRDRGWRSVVDSDAVKVKALVARDGAELDALWPGLAAMERPLVAQRFVPGPESAIESYHVYVDARGETVAEFTGKKIRTWPLECGFTTSLRVVELPDVRALGRELVRRMGFRGVAKFDVKRDPDGRLWLFEVNARTSLWMHPGARAGVNIAAAMHADLSGGPRPALAAHPRRVSWVHPKDLWAARAAGVPLPRWAAFAAGARAKAFWSWRDPMPFLGMLASRARSGDFT